VKALEMAKQGSDIVVSGECKTNGYQQVQTSDNKEVNKITRPRWYNTRSSMPDRATGNPTTKPVHRGCGKDAHPTGSFCPAKGKSCLRYGRINHFARMCPAKK